MTHTEIVAILKKELKNEVEGKVLVRKDSRYRIDIQKNVTRYNIFFDTATTANVEVITGNIAAFSHLGVHRISNLMTALGAYGNYYAIEIVEPAK